MLPLFALFLVVLLGFAALAIDVSGAFAARRFYRSTADAAALAGAQDMQVTGGRSVTSAERIRARQHAMESLVQGLGISGTLPGACGTSSDADVTDACVLPGTTYHVTIRAGTTSGAGAIACVNCDPARSVQVGLRNAAYALSFARVLGQTTWNVGVTSVAGLAFSKSYAIMTLRPPKATGSTFNVNDIILNGTGTVVNVHRGDVGSNANMTYSGTSTVVNLDSGYGMYYFDPYFAPKWYPSAPIPPAQIVEQLSNLIADPNYSYPSMSGAPVFDDARGSQAGSIPAVTRADADPTCAAEATKVDPARYTFMTTQTLDTIYCYNPGVYQSGSGAKNATITIGTGTVGILKPGAYYLKSGLDVSGRIVGGYEAAKPGVALMFDESGPGNCSSCIFSGNNALTIALNAGTKFPYGSAGTAATAAIDWSGQPVETSGAGSPTPALLITLLVKKDTGGAGGSQACIVPTSAPFVEPSGCDDGKNQAINIAGGGQLDLEGVQYAPTDNVAVAGSSDGRGTVGQIIAWTVSYSGGTTLNQEGPGTEGPGTLRLDAACTAASTPCNP
ncbi:MAG TPA: pilus assembly protein TadG-related protein [Candidatus Limnocylindrales bacterium]